ncbi:hypothetical protein Pelo_1453 [Pelomyxa schiedti]|nr:hypothetical protein Pelo_1453 [Pelomyxa schiedti]
MLSAEQPGNHVPVSVDHARGVPLARRHELVVAHAPGDGPVALALDGPKIRAARGVAPRDVRRRAHADENVGHSRGGLREGERERAADAAAAPGDPVSAKLGAQHVAVRQCFRGTARSAPANRRARKRNELRAQVGTTITLRNAHSGGAETVCAHLFMGVSATLGVVWCKWLDPNAFSKGSYLERVDGCVGDDRFMTTSFWAVSKIVDSSGNVVSDLGGPESDPFAFCVSNNKWLVRVENVDDVALFTAWRTSNGVPVSSGVGGTCTAPLNGTGAKFSPFDPYSDELFFVGSSNSSSLLSSVNLEKGIGY